MSLTIELPPDVEKLLQADARASGRGPAELVAQILRERYAALRAERAATDPATEQAWLARSNPIVDVIDAARRTHGFPAEWGTDAGPLPTDNDWAAAEAAAATGKPLA